MNVGELRKALEDAQGILEAAGAKAPSKDLKAFLEIFAGCEEQDVNAFLAELRQKISCGSVAKPKTVRLPDADTVERYFNRFSVAGNDKIAFDKVYDDLIADSAIQKEEVDAIAHRLTQGRRQWSSKSDGLSAIRGWFSDTSYQAVKLQRVDEGTPWKGKRAQR